MLEAVKEDTRIVHDDIEENKNLEEQVHVLQMQFTKKLTDMIEEEEERERLEKQLFIQKKKEDKTREESEGFSRLRKSSLESFNSYCDTELLNIHKYLKIHRQSIDGLTLGVDAKKEDRETNDSKYSVVSFPNKLT